MDAPVQTILVAMGNQRESLTIKSVLEKMNFNEVQVESNGLAALKRIQKKPYEFIIVDWDLPQLSGLKLLREIRLNKSTADTLALLVAPKLGQNDMAEAKKAGINGMLLKPVTPEALEASLKDIFGLNEEEEGEEDTTQSIVDEADRLLDLGQHEQALAQFQVAVKDGRSRVANLHTDIGTVLHKQGKHGEAIENLKQAIETDPNLTRPYATLGRSYLATGDTDNAKATLQQALVLDPDNDDAKIAMADTHLKLGENSEAEKIYSVVLEHRPEDIYVFNRLGIAFRVQKKYDQAVANYRRALKINSRDENLYFNLGRCYIEMGQKEMAQKCFSNAVKLNPEHKQAKDILARLTSNSK